MRTDRKSAIRGMGLPIDEALKFEAQCFNEGFASEDTIEGLRRFVERDHPDRKAGGSGSTGVRRSRL